MFHWVLGALWKHTYDKLSQNTLVHVDIQLNWVVQIKTGWQTINETTQVTEL